MVKLQLEFPEGFFDPETRCGHFVSAEMKKIWAVEMDLLAELLRVCDKHALKIFAGGGTMLGAVRHKGFIPWDDDIDMIMPRADYNRLCSIASQEFKEPYFFQTADSDEGYMKGFAKLINTGTTSMTKEQAETYIPSCFGIWVDVFPMDQVVDDEKLFQKQKDKARRWRRLASFASDLTTRYGRVRKRKDPVSWLIRLLHPFLSSFVLEHRLCSKALKKCDETWQMYNGQPCQMVGDITYSHKPRMLVTDLAKQVYFPFEHMEIPLCNGWDHALRLQYGDYMEFVKGHPVHAYLIDTDKSYREYQKEQLSGTLFK